MTHPDLLDEEAIRSDAMDYADRLDAQRESEEARYDRVASEIDAKMDALLENEHRNLVEAANVIDPKILPIIRLAMRLGYVECAEENGIVL